MTLLSVENARRQILDVVLPLPSEMVPLSLALGRTLASDIASLRTQPPFAASAMDGYAVRTEDLATLPASLRVVGEAAAGRSFDHTISTGDAVRIFTGAPVPNGADAVVIQENAERPKPDEVRILAGVTPGKNIRPAGLDFRQGDVLLKAGHTLSWRDIALAASMDHPELPVIRKPKVAILATGDELVRPGEARGPAQIVASNSYGLAAYIRSLGGDAIDLGIASDRKDDLIGRLQQAVALGPDIIVTLGGASVGDHDLVRDALGEADFNLAFWKIAMRPGKPMIFGRIGGIKVLGLPGNPVSSLVGATLFLSPLLATLLGQDASQYPKQETAVLAEGLKPNDSRADYLRAHIVERPGGVPLVAAFDVQDSSMLRTFAEADCLIVRQPFAEAADIGATCSIIRL